MNYLEFQSSLSGFTFHDKKTGQQVYRYILFLKKLTPKQCFSNYESRKIPKQIELI
jgi:hypothetical protein